MTAKIRYLGSLPNRQTMKTYRGVRSQRGCEVTVDGEPLARRSDLSGNATNAFDWGFVGTGQLSLAILADFLGDDSKAKAMCSEFEEKIIAELPHQSWTLSGQDLNNALALFCGGDDAIAVSNDDSTGSALGDMPVKTSNIALRRTSLQGLPKKARRLLLGNIRSLPKNRQRI